MEDFRKRWEERAQELGKYKKAFMDIVDSLILAKHDFISDQVTMIQIDKETGLLNKEQACKFCRTTISNVELIDNKSDIILEQFYDIYTAQKYIDEHPELMQEESTEDAETNTDETADEGGTASV